MKDFLELRRDEFTKYFEELPDLNSLRVPSRTFDKSKNKLKEGYSWVPSQSNPDPVFRFSKTTRINKPKDGQKAEYEGYSIYKKDTPPAPVPVPAPVPKPEPTPEPELPIKLSERAAKANAYTDAYERKFLPYKGDYIFDDQSVEQNFKNQYQTNLTNELKTKYPAVFGEKTEAIKANDKKQLDYSDYALKLGQY